MDCTKVFVMPLTLQLNAEGEGGDGLLCMSLPQSALLSIPSCYTNPLSTPLPFTGYISPLHRLNILYSLTKLLIYLHCPHKHKNTIYLHCPHKQHKNTFLLGIYTVIHSHAHCT